MIVTEVLPSIALGVTVFVATNVDDVLLLAAFFADKRLRRANIDSPPAIPMNAIVIEHVPVA
jgi:cadmium resistance protein CadD (predicted permease)